MIFVKFYSKNPNDTRYFVGATLQDVLDDTNGGKSFGHSTFNNYKVISEKTARELKLGYLDYGIKSIMAGDTKSFCLSDPQA